MRRVKISYGMILICGDPTGIEQPLGAAFRSRGAQVDVSVRNYSEAAAMLETTEYSMVLLLAADDSPNCLRLAEKAARERSNAATVVLTYTISARVRKSFYRAGAARCLVMPMTVGEICTAVSDQLGYADRRDKYRDMYELMKQLGFPVKLNGFEYLLYAVTLTVDDPARLGSMTGTLYPEIASRFGVTAAQAERSLRYLSESLDSTSVFCRFYGLRSGESLNNRELIALTADLYVCYMRDKLGM